MSNFPGVSVEVSVSFRIKFHSPPPVSIRLQGVSGPYLGCFVRASCHVSAQSSLFHDFWYLSVRLCGPCQGHLGPCMPTSFFWFDLRTSPDHPFLISLTLPPHFLHFCLEYGDMKFLRNLDTYLHVTVRFKLLSSQLQ
jgi:hypothetical protein